MLGGLPHTQEPSAGSLPRPLQRRRHLRRAALAVWAVAKGRVALRRRQQALPGSPVLLQAQQGLHLAHRGRGEACRGALNRCIGICQRSLRVPGLQPHPAAVGQQQVGARGRLHKNTKEPGGGRERRGEGAGQSIMSAAVR